MDGRNPESSKKPRNPGMMVWGKNTSKRDGFNHSFRVVQEFSMDQGLPGSTGPSAYVSVKALPHERAAQLLPGQNLRLRAKPRPQSVNPNLEVKKIAPHP